MREAEIPGPLVLREQLIRDLRAIGVRGGMTLLVHSSMKAIGGWMPGGAVDVVLALEHVLGETGTLVMPTHSSDLSDPAGWEQPPVRESWWEPIRRTMPAYDPDMTPTWRMGAIPECFRKQRGTVRSMHPQLSFAARGRFAAFVAADHGYAFGLGEQSPLARVYELDGWVLLLGVGHGNNTSLHLAESRAAFKGKTEVTARAPVTAGGERQWIAYRELDYDSSDFAQIGQAFGEQTDAVRQGAIGSAQSLLMPQRALVDFGIGWMERHRRY